MRVPTGTFYQQQMYTLNNQYQNIQQLNQQISKQSNLVSSSDDPVLAYNIAQINDYMNDLTSYSQSTISAQARAQAHEGATQQVVNFLDQLQQLVIRAQDDTQTDSDRATYAQQAQSLLNNLLNLANTQDGNGDYIFSGFNSSVPAYALSNGAYQYQGSYETTSVSIGDGVSAVYNESGFSVFGDIRLGNGTFTVSASPNNTGAASTDSGAIINGTPYVSDTYTISFVTNSSGQLAYQVTGATTGQVIPAPPATVPADAPQYKPGELIQFNGVGLTIKGAANVGDTFTVQQSPTQDLFDTVQGIITALQTSTNGNPVAIAQLHQTLSQGMASLRQASSHMLAYHSEIGARLASINEQISDNANLLFDQQSIFKSLNDLDMPSALTGLESLKFQLEATQGSYMQIQKLLSELLNSR